MKPFVARSTARHAEKYLGLLLALSFGCSSSDAGNAAVTRTPDEVMDPQTCAGCHPKQYEQWASSMHAYAADDPLFLAMNRRGQREAQIGPFCVNCHAPVAVRTGATSDGLNLESLPQKLKGVTCYYCHSVDSVAGTHDNPLHLAADGVMRGELSDPAANGFHSSKYSSLHDRDQLESSNVCGSCHDIVNGHGVHLERTFEEWQKTAFAQPKIGTTCGQCHMDRSLTPEPAAVASGAPNRYLRSHLFPAVDLPLTPAPGADVLSDATQTFLDTSLQAALCVRGAGANAEIQVVLDSVAAGHGFPSGATQDRRAWLEVKAYAKDKAIYQSGVVDADSSLGAADSTDLAWFGDCLLDAQGNQVRMFWEATDIESNLLPALLTFDVSDPRYYQSHVFTTYPRNDAAISVYPDRVTLDVHLAPFDLDVFDSLVQSGDLTPTAGMSTDALRQQLAARSVGQQLEWTPDSVTESFVERGLPIKCVSTGASNLRAAADKVAAVDHTRCGP